MNKKIAKQLAKLAMEEEEISILVDDENKVVAVKAGRWVSSEWNSISAEEAAEILDDEGYGELLD